jgi:serine/threonine protein kinase
MPKRKTRKAKKQKGGVFIAEGTYGCGFANPPLPCQGETTRRSDKYLSKLMSAKDAEDELQMAKPFRKLDPTQQYFLTPSSSCKLDKDKIVPENNYKSCKKQKSGELLFFEYGGQDLEQLELPVTDVIPLFESIPNLFEGLSLIHTSNIYHMDIKPPNLVTVKKSDGTYHSRFIDFGLALFPPNDITSDKTYQTIYKSWSFDVIVAYFGQDVTKALRHFSNWKQTQFRFNPQCIPDQQFEGFDETSLQAIYQPVLGNTSLLLSKADVFALGLTLSNVMYNLTGHLPSNQETVRNTGRNIPTKKTENLSNTNPFTQYHKELADKVTGPFYDMISHMLEIDPQKRYTAEEAKEHFQKILPRIRTYLTAQNVEQFCKPLQPYSFQ